MEHHSLIGTWRLISFEVRDEHEQIHYPLGSDAVGYLNYTEDGHVFVAMMRSQRPSFALADPGKGTQEEKIGAHDSYMTYCGIYTREGNLVTHHLELSLFPNWVGTDLSRTIEFQGDRLFLKSPPRIAFGRKQVGYLIWERAA